MAFCQSCGASIAENQAACASCGNTAVAVGAGTPLASNVAALLTYVPCIITAIIFLAIEPYKRDRFVRFNAFQSIYFGVAWIVFWIVWNVVQLVLGAVTAGMLALVTFPITMLLSLGGLVYWAFLLYKAYNNQEYMVPILGAMAAKHVG